MRLLDKPFTRHEREIELDILQGNICRICVSNDPLEIVRMVGFACSRISMLAQSNMLEIKNKEE